MESNQLNYSTLNENIIPDKKFVKEINEYTPKFSEDLTKLLCNELGLNTPDNRVHKLIALSTQQFMEDILQSTAQAIISKKNNNKFLEKKELLEILKEKGIANSSTNIYNDNIYLNLDKK